MRGLEEIPTRRALVRAYNRLQSQSPVTEKDIVLFAHWSRFDPRLGEILITSLRDHWIRLNPLLLRELNQQGPWPQALAVIFEHLRHTTVTSAEIFQHFAAIVCEGMTPASYQSFTIGLFKMAGKEQKERAFRPHPFFSKWGYYEGEPFFSKHLLTKPLTSMDKSTRKKILKDLLDKKKRITVTDYLEACRFAVHRRQAERDLSRFFKLRKSGQTRSRVYFR